MKDRGVGGVIKKNRAKERGRAKKKDTKKEVEGQENGKRRRWFEGRRFRSDQTGERRIPPRLYKRLDRGRPGPHAFVVLEVDVRLGPVLPVTHFAHSSSAAWS